MELLITRPLEDARRTAALLQARGHQVLVAPLLDIGFRDGPPLALDGVQAILATSANAVRALARRTGRRDLPVFAVGPQTAEAARAAGFAAVKSADGDAAALAEATRSWVRPDGGALFHPCGAATKGDLAARLTAAGFTVRSEILYDAVPLPHLPGDVATALEAGEIAAALFYSPRTARSFAAAVETAGLHSACRRLTALCMSPATAQALAGLAFGAVRIAAHPDQDHMLALLD